MLGINGGEILLLILIAIILLYPFPAIGLWLPEVLYK